MQLHYNKNKKDVVKLKRNTYRLCVVMLIVVALISTIWYYQAFEKKNLQPKEGIFVWKTPTEGHTI